MNDFIKLDRITDDPIGTMRKNARKTMPPKIETKWQKKLYKHLADMKPHKVSKNFHDKKLVNYAVDRDNACAFTVNAKERGKADKNTVLIAMHNGNFVELKKRVYKQLLSITRGAVRIVINSRAKHNKVISSDMVIDITSINDILTTIDMIQSLRGAAALVTPMTRNSDKIIRSYWCLDTDNGIKFTEDVYEIEDILSLISD